MENMDNSCELPTFPTSFG